MSAISSKKIDGDDLKQLTIAQAISGANGSEMNVKDDQQGSLLKFKCKVKGNKTVLSGHGWQQFVRDNGVQVGHTVAIYYNDQWCSSGAKYKIEVRK